MTQEEKQLVLTDICARLPYGVICQMEDEYIINDSQFYDHILSEQHIELFRKHRGFYIKPYLRPMSSMTEKEKKEFQNLCNEMLFGCIFTSDRFDWLNAHHFDYRGLIPKGLAIEAPEEIYINKL